MPTKRAKARKLAEEKRKDKARVEKSIGSGNVPKRTPKSQRQAEARQATEAEKTSKKTK